MSRLSIDSVLRFDCAAYLAGARYGPRARFEPCHDTALQLACGWLFANRVVRAARRDLANTPPHACNLRYAGDNK